MLWACPQKSLSPLLAAGGIETSVFTPCSLRWLLEVFPPCKMSIGLVLLCFLLWARLSLCSCVGVARFACYTRLNSSVRNDRYFGGISVLSLPSECTHEHTTLTHTQMHICRGELSSFGLLLIWAVIRKASLSDESLD